MDRAFKERLSGAVVMVGLAVILIPLLLDEPVSWEPEVDLEELPLPADSLDPRFPILEQELDTGATKDFPTRLTTLDVSPDAANTTPEQAPAEPERRPSGVPEQERASIVAIPQEPSEKRQISEARAVSDDSSTPQQEAEPATTKQVAAISATLREKLPAAPGENAWVVQLGGFARRDNAQMLIDRLRKSGYRAFINPAEGRDAVLYRVQVGPELSRGQARKQRDELHKKFDIEGIIRTYP